VYLFLYLFDIGKSIINFVVIEKGVSGMNLVAENSATNVGNQKSYNS